MSLFIFAKFILPDPVWIRGALSRRSGNMCFHISRNKQIIRTRPPQGRTGSDYMGLSFVAEKDTHPKALYPNGFDVLSDLYFCFLKPFLNPPH